MELAAGDTDGVCGHQTRDKLENSELEQQQEINTEVERVNFEDNQKSECEDRTIQIEKLPDNQKSECEDRTIQIEKLPDNQNYECEVRTIQIEKLPDNQKCICEDRTVQIEKLPDSQKSECEDRTVQIEKLPDNQKSECEDRTIQIEKLPDNQKSECEDRTIQIEKLPDSQKSECEDRTIQIEKLPEKDAHIEDNDADKVCLNVSSSNEAGIAVEGEADVCIVEINEASEEDKREINNDIMLENSLTEAKVRNEDASSSDLPAMRDDTDREICDAAIVDVSPECQGQPHKVTGLAAEIEQDSGEVDCGGGENIAEGAHVWQCQKSMSHGPDSCGTAGAADQAQVTKEIATEGIGHDQAQVTIEPVIEGVGHDQSTVEDMFNTTQQGSLGQDVHLSYFPALDNVDLETDEEGQEFEKDVDDTEKGQKVTGSRQKSEEVCDSSFLISVGHDSGDSTLVGSTLCNDYPLNYQNYKVCREVRPGVKECLILETGEQFFCITKPHSQSVGSPEPDSEAYGANKPASLVQPENAGSGHGHTGATPVTADDNLVQLTSGSVSVLSRAEVFSYVSLQEDGQDKTEPRTCHLFDTGQQAYITDNGVPVILDSAEDDVGLDGDVENGERAENTETGNTADDVLHNKRDEGPRQNVVEDVLSSEGEINWSPQPKENKEHSMKKSKKEKHDKFYKLKPDVAADTEMTGGSQERDSNFNNSANHMDLEGEGNTNENANSHRSKRRETVHRGEACIQSSSIPSTRSLRPESSNHTHSYDHRSTSSRDVNQSGSRNYHQSTSKDSSYFGSQDYSKVDSSYHRSRDPSSVDSSQISTRYTRIHQPDSNNVPARTESITVPKFKTLQDQQVSWLDMFKVIEQQHRTELQSQYLEHQKVLHEMQKNMEKELLKQQDMLKQRLMSHREMLEDLSPYRHAGQNINHSWTQSEDVSSMDSHRVADHGLTNNTSQITLQGVPVALRNPPPMSRYHHDGHEHKFGDEIPVKRSLEKELQSPVKPADTSLNHATSVSIDRDKQLKGGVYSSPFPLAQVKYKKSPRASKSYESTQRGYPRGEVSHNSNSIHWGQDARPRDTPNTGSPDVSFADSDDVLSPRTRISLREKHAKHLADVRAYYEKELQDLRREREMKAGGDGWTQNATVEQRILANENQELRQKYQHLQDAYHDAKIEIRELQQKIQGLEIRAADYAERYNGAQSQVLALKSRLEELADFVRDKESLIADLESKNRKNTDSLQLAYKKEKDLADSLHNARNTIQKLVDKYETLEKDHDIVKESLVETQEKLYASRAEVIEVNNKLSRSELENKQLKHDIENLKLDLAVARSAVPMQTSYEEAYHKMSSSEQHPSSYSQAHGSRSRSTDRSYINHHRNDDNEDDDRGETTAESESDREYSRSPLIKAESELKLRQQSREFTPKLQRKFYGTEIPTSYGGPPITVDRTSIHSVDSPHSSTNPSPRDKRAHAVYRDKEIISRSGSSKSSSYLPGSPKDRSRLSRDGEKRSPGGTYKDRDSNKIHSISPQKLTKLSNGLSSEQALERIKSGDVVSRPAWEDVYTSLAAGRPAGGHESSTPPSSYTRDHIIRERLQNIDNLEKKYNDLTNEKRNFEAALSKLPTQGHGRDRDKLESELDRVDRELGSVRMSLKRYHVLKSTI